ncbi:MAG: UDP-2,4-diacetamido-2,4,6-trideoxy-beta-L-altropyranose hydrolase [Butyrivibrio sp.]|nr:UDP-2,4-diacetamido-2,4,6-trideoxy-beta-L-altropyranose hydrolase [Acetatifactor muris]MCM1559875.1 UDP-2,4-diacetamido-2,4,6-trideoxy-beta-L-altropyranose hydrolase [Butyrivibrio sp.]
MIFIRADANERIGTGHVMRCMAIAEALEQRGQQVCFLLADDTGSRLLQDRNREYLVLHTDYASMEEELPRLRQLLQEKKPDFFLADSYCATPEYLREVRKIVPVGLLDDTGLTGYPADVLINYNIFASDALYDVSEETETRYLLGPAYVPLRREFTEAAYRVRERAERVLITTGGSDTYNLGTKLLKRALAEADTANLQYTVVSGAYNIHFEELQELACGHENVHVCSNVSNMRQLMQESDLAVSAGGSTMYELSAVGVPVICFSFVDNQKRIVQGFAERGLVCFGGDYSAMGESLPEEIVYHMGRLAADYKLRKSCSQRLRKLVDGRGALRIAGELCRYGNCEEGT